MTLGRRRLLALLGGAGAAALAGCLGSGGDDRAGSEERGDGPGAGTPAPAGSGPTTGAETAGLARHGTPPTICEEDVRPDPGIYAVVDPAFASDWSGHEVDPTYGPELADDDVVIGVESGDRARAYPLSVLYYHEVVNDDFGGPLLVTFCPLCDSGLVADRLVDGVETNFHVTGLLWRAPGIQSAAAEKRGDVFGVDSFDPDAELRHRGNLVFTDDHTGSYWSQILARAICGPRTGATLTVRPSSTARWGEWRRRHPGTDVLLPPPHSTTDRRAENS